MSVGQTLFVPLLLGLTGCASMTGLDGQGFSCKAPDGISCASLSGVYANAVQNNLPGQRPVVKPGHVLNAQARIDAMAPRSGDPLRSAQKVRRVWLAPWEDDDEVLHDQSYFYMVVDSGRWQIEHSRRKATESYRPVVPPKTFAAIAINGWTVPANGACIATEWRNVAAPAARSVCAFGAVRVW